MREASVKSRTLVVLGRRVRVGASGSGYGWRAVGAALLIASYSCTSSSERESAAALSDAGSGDGAPSAALSDAGSDGLRLAQLSARLTEIRPRTTVGPEANAADVDAQTAWWPITGTATFRTTAESVDLIVRARDCRTPYSYPVFIYAERDCSKITSDSKPWDGARGTLKSKALCVGAPGASLYESRSNADPNGWTLGGPTSSNVMGRAIAIHDPDTLEPLACGTIEAVDGGLPWVPLSPEKRPSNFVVEQLAGVCGLGIVPSKGDAGPTCPNPDRLSDCALTHCVSGCVDTCADYISCLESSDEACTSACEASGACVSCLHLLTLCTAGFCGVHLACSPPPTPGGPCTQLRECCMRQGPLVESCLSYAELLERLSGDPSCLGALFDRDVNAHYTYRSPCYPDGGVPME